MSRCFIWGGQGFKMDESFNFTARHACTHRIICILRNEWPHGSPRYDDASVWKNMEKLRPPDMPAERPQRPAAWGSFHGATPVIIHFRFGFPLLNHPFWGTPNVGNPMKAYESPINGKVSTCFNLSTNRNTLFPHPRPSLARPSCREHFGSALSAVLSVPLPQLLKTRD